MVQRQGNNESRELVRTLTDGTVGVLDPGRAHVTVALHGYFFEKTVADLTTGANPATTAAPGDTLRYTLRLQTTDGPVTTCRSRRPGSMNQRLCSCQARSRSLRAIPAGVDTSNTNPNGGTNGAGILDLRNLTLPGPARW